MNQSTHHTHSLFNTEAKSTSKSATKEKVEKQKRKKRDASAPKKPMCAFFWYQRDPKNHINDANLQHKDKIKVSCLLFRESPVTTIFEQIFGRDFKSITISEKVMHSGLKLAICSKIGSIYPTFPCLSGFYGSAWETSRILSENLVVTFKIGQFTNFFHFHSILEQTPILRPASWFTNLANKSASEIEIKTPNLDLNFNLSQNWFGRLTGMGYRSISVRFWLKYLNIWPSIRRKIKCSKVPPKNK